MGIHRSSICPPTFGGLNRKQFGAGFTQSILVAISAYLGGAFEPTCTLKNRFEGQVRCLANKAIKLEHS